MDIHITQYGMHPVVDPINYTQLLQTKECIEVHILHLDTHITSTYGYLHLCWETQFQQFSDF